MIQYFHWYLADNGSLWKFLNEHSQQIAQAGFTSVWLPPAYKGAAGSIDTGYGVYDLYDLGEFDQKGSIRTKYGTRTEYLEALASLKRAGMSCYGDIVLNHRMGADTYETVQATPYQRDNRAEAKGEIYEIEAFTHFTFPGRKGAYSQFQWHWYHFNAVDHDARNPEDTTTIYVFEGKTFDDYVSSEYGNYDYLMGCDLDFENEDVRDELTSWGKWYLEATKLDGFRLDAVKHISSWFFPKWLDEMQKHSGSSLFTVGEYWDPRIETLHGYIEQTNGTISLFDVPLHYRFHEASQTGDTFDMQTILDSTLMKERPDLAVTFVANHDSQPLQALESVVEPWFKPIAYALILLRREGYPCVFHADYYGAEYSDTGSDGNDYQITMPSHRQMIDTFLYARKNFTFGKQHDYFDHPNCIGWTFSGDGQHPGSLAVVLSNGSEGSKEMITGSPNTRFIDLTSHVTESVITDNDGIGEFCCNGGSVSVWIEASLKE